MEYSGDDIYCDLILNGKLEVEEVFESENVAVFHHGKPSWPVHIVVVPKKHIPSFTNVPNEDAVLVSELMDVVKTIAQKVEEQEGAARVLTNLGEYQDSKHLHFHVYSGEPLKNRDHEE